MLDKVILALYDALKNEFLYTQGSTMKRTFEVRYIITALLLVSGVFFLIALFEWLQVYGLSTALAALITAATSLVISALLFLWVLLTSSKVKEIVLAKYIDEIIVAFLEGIQSGETISREAVDTNAEVIKHKKYANTN